MEKLKPTSSWLQRSSQTRPMTVLLAGSQFSEIAAYSFYQIYVINSVVAMATSPENLGNEFEIANHENTTIAAKMKIWCIYGRSYGQFCAFVAMQSKIQLPWKPPL